MRDRRKEEREDKKEEGAPQTLGNGMKSKRKERVRWGQEESMQCHYA